MKRIVAAVLLLAAAGSSVRASQFGPFTRESQVHTSDAVVVGRVVALDSYWTTNRDVILTDAEIVIEDIWKGSPPGRILVQTLGGAVGDVLLHVDGAAMFAPGERTVLFLERRADRWVPVGMHFGKLAVTRAEAGTFAVGPLPLATGDGRLPDVVSMSLEDLRAEVLGIVEAGR